MSLLGRTDYAKQFVGEAHKLPGSSRSGYKNIMGGVLVYIPSLRQLNWFRINTINRD